jgi:DNA-damage-inducible protein J
MSTATVSVQVDEDVKRRAEEVLQRSGTTTAEIIQWVLWRAAEDGALPFEMGMPNAETIEAMKARERGDTKRGSIEDFFRDLHADD